MNNLLSNSIIARCKLKISKWRSTVKSYIENFKKYRFLLWELVKKGVKLKYRRSYLGILWTLLEPLMTMIVLSVVFGTLFGNKDPHFPVYILCGR